MLAPHVALVCVKRNERAAPELDLRHFILVQLSFGHTR
jgi:hypothetical protein